MAREKLLEESIKKYLRSNGVYPFGTPLNEMNKSPLGYYEKRWGGGEYTKSGLPDMHIVINAESVDIELKCDKGYPSPLQVHNLKQLTISGCDAFIVCESQEGVNSIEHYVKTKYPDDANYIVVLSWIRFRTYLENKLKRGIN